MSANTPTQATTPGGRTGTPKDIKDSLAALRSVLMIDTPTKSLLSGSHPSIAAQQSRYEASKQNWEELATLRNKAAELKNKVREATSVVEQETRKRKTLQTTYEALAKTRKELSLQLELVTKSREISEEKLASMRKTLSEEQAAIARERAQWRPEMECLKSEKSKLEKKLSELEHRCKTAEETVKNLTKEVTGLTTIRKKLEEQLESTVSNQAVLRPQAEKAENERRRAKENLAKVENELNIIKKRHQKSLSSMLEIKQDLKKKLEAAQLEKKTALDELEKTKAALKNIESIKNEAIDKMKDATSNGESRNRANAAATEKIKSFESDLEKSEDAVKKGEEEIKSLMHRLQESKNRNEELVEEIHSLKLSHSKSDPNASFSKEQKLAEGSSQDEPDCPTASDDGGIPSSIVALDLLIQDAMDSNEDGFPAGLLEKIAESTRTVKADMIALQSAKEKVESKLSATIASEERRMYELAQSREKLRETNDNMLDMREESNRLREEVAALNSQLGSWVGMKRGFDDLSDAEDRGDDTEHGSSPKKAKGGLPPRSEMI